MSIMRNRLPVLAVAVAVAGVVAGLPALASAQAAAPARQSQKAEVKLAALPKDGKIAKLEDLVGKTAYEFTLTDTEGNQHTLSDYLDAGKIVVLEWFNPTCPYVVRQYQGETTMNDSVARYNGKDVVWLAVATGSTASDETGCQKAREKWRMNHPVLLDESGAVGKAYGSKNTPTMYVIGTDGTLAYGGAIDNNANGRNTSPTNYVVEAVDALLAGSNIETTYAKPYGCGVKYKR